MDIKGELSLGTGECARAAWKSPVLSGQDEGKESHWEFIEHYSLNKMYFNLLTKFFSLKIISAHGGKFRK